MRSNGATPRSGSLKTFQEALRSIGDDKSATGKSGKSNRSRRSSERPQKKKTNFIKLNAKQLTRVKTTVKAPGQQEKIINIFDQKKIKIRNSTSTNQVISNKANIN